MMRIPQDRWLILALAWLGWFSYGAIGQAHESRPAYLELTQTGEDTFDLLWKVPAQGDSLRLGLYVRLPDSAERLTEPLSMFVGGAFVEQWSFREPAGLVGTTIHIDGLRHTLTDVLVRIQRLDGTTQVARLMPESPSLEVVAAPSGWLVARTYFLIGVEHILLGADHLLFVLGLFLLVDRVGMLIKTITAFTIAHSITLALSVFSVIRVPDVPLNAAIALSILFLGPELVRRWRGESSLTIRHPWVVAFAFGLLHGVGFASGLSMTGLPPSEIPSALLFFNLGVEAGQLACVVLAILCAKAVHTLELDQPKHVRRIPAYVVGSLGAFWTIQRVAILLELENLFLEF
jgi:hydrogenase/urease accessory protein HupE